MLKRTFRQSVAAIVVIWIFLALYIVYGGHDPSSLNPNSTPNTVKPLRGPAPTAPSSPPAVRVLQGMSLPAVPSSGLYHPNSTIMGNPPILPSISDTLNHLHNFLTELKTKLLALPINTLNAEIIWTTYHDVVMKTLIPWDDLNFSFLPSIRQDDSIYVSIASYRDTFCPETLFSIYTQAKYPEKVFVGVVQQNCVSNCKSGVLENGVVESAPPDMDCYTIVHQKLFLSLCPSYATNNLKTDHISPNIIIMRVDEADSLGPYFGRYLASHLHRLEQFYLQIDSHMFFDVEWDRKLVEMVKLRSGEGRRGAVISNYPPGHLTNWIGTAGTGLCDAGFAASDIESQIIRLDSPVNGNLKKSVRSALVVNDDHDDDSVRQQKHKANSMKGKPQLIGSSPADVKYSAYVAAGFIFAPSHMLYHVPFDPLLPWIFMGEEISLSARLWTSGYDLFAPSVNVLSHVYVRRHMPKFWETINRFFKKQIYNSISDLVVKRIKHLFRYPESVYEYLRPMTLLDRLEMRRPFTGTVQHTRQQYGMGVDRPLDSYLRVVGIDTTKKISVRPAWCHEGRSPEFVL